MSTNRRAEAIKERKKRRRISSSEEATWLQAAEAGDALAGIAKRAGVDVRTVRQHVDRAKLEKEVGAVRLSMVRAAADLHQQDLLGVAASLEAALDPSIHSLHASLELTPGAVRSAGKRYTALVGHTKGSGLPHALSLWEAAAGRYATAVAQLRQLLEGEIGDTTLSPEGTVDQMLVRLAQCADYGAVAPDRLVWRVEAGSLRKGAYHIVADVSAMDEPRAVDAQEQHALLWTTISAAPPVADLCALRSAEATRERVRDLLEDLRLRRYLGPGTCRWCPGAPATPRRKTGNRAKPESKRGG
jgi:hypothetical protein